MIKLVTNNNGSSREDLIKQRTDVMDALYAAVTLLRKAMPNGRDYIHNQAQCDADRQKQYDRILVLHEMRDELLAEALFIQKGMAA